MRRWSCLRRYAGGGRHGGDDVAARVIAARLVEMMMYLAFLLEKRWAPYAKWQGSLFERLRCAHTVGPALDHALQTPAWPARQRGIGAALTEILRVQCAAGVTAPAPAVTPFWERPHLVPHERVAASVLARVTSPDVRALPAGFGSVEQRTHNVAILMDPAARRRLAALGASRCSASPSD